MVLRFDLIMAVLAALALSCQPQEPRPEPEPDGPGASKRVPLAYEPPQEPDYPRAEWVGDACGYWPAERTAADIDLVVIHTCQWEFYDCWAYLASCHRPSSSAHYVVQSSDGLVVQMVGEAHRAWHATCVNDRSIGIEHEGYVQDPDLWFTDAMYCSSANLVRWIADRYAIPLDRDHIMGHDEANALYCNGTHTDPGPGWDWDFYMHLIRQGCDPCFPGERRCRDGADLVECNGDGMTWTTVGPCSTVTGP